MRGVRGMVLEPLEERGGGGGAGGSTVVGHG